MGSHSVTCHPTQVNALCHNPSQTGRYSIYRGVFRIWQRGAWRARGARTYNGGLGGGAPSGIQGQSPWSGGCPLKLKHFLLLNVQWKPQIFPFFDKKRTFSIVACKKFSWSGQRWGGIAPCPPLNTPLSIYLRQRDGRLS